MANLYYIMTKDIGDGPHLIGKLEKLDRENCQFQYMIKGNDFPYFILHLPNLHDVSKVYNTEETWIGIMSHVVPENGSHACRLIQERHGLDPNRYNVWDFLEYLISFHNDLTKKAHIRLPFHDSYERIYFYEEIPRRCYRYD